MNDTRPVFLNPSKMRFPIMAIASILHRLSGLLLFVFILFTLWALDCSLSSAQGFAAVQHLFSSLWMKLLLCFLFAGLIYHLFAGIRHLLMDVGIGESLSGGRMAAWLVIILSLIATVIAGVWLW